MSKARFDELLQGYLNNQLSEEELRLFLSLLQQSENQAKLTDSIDSLLKKKDETKADPQTADALFQRIMKAAEQHEGERDVPVKKMHPRFRFVRYIAAACLVGLLLFGAYQWFGKDSKKEMAVQPGVAPSATQDVLPGGDKAVLTLADGTRIILDEATNGTLAKQGTAKIIKIDGKLAYAAERKGGEVLYNTITTPKGGQYQVELADGSQVWLNANSSLRFPTAFVGGERRVEITGEAYLEVAKNTAKPFFVNVVGSEIQVLGTHFNVMAYNDEPALRTTLLEGAVRFVHNNQGSMLRPGQQSVLKKDGQVQVENDVDIENVMAWKNGKFSFQGVDVGTLTRQLARWYDVEIVYNKPVSELFYAKFSRNIKLSDALKALELTGKVRFAIDGRKIIVEP